MAFDILVLAAPKDYLMLPFVLRAIERNLEGYDGVYLCTPTPLDVSTLPIPVHPLLDMNVLEAEPRRWRHRPNWVYQQFIKLFQEATPNDMYLVVDADVFVNAPLPMFEGATPIWWTGIDQHHEPYFRFSEQMLGIGRAYAHSFIADMFFFSRSLVRDMLRYGGYSVDSFIEKSYAVISGDCYVSEAEMYMNYVYSRHPGAYIIRELRTAYRGRNHDDPEESLWSPKEIRAAIQEFRETDRQTFSLHSWCDESHDRWAPADRC